MHILHTNAHPRNVTMMRRLLKSKFSAQELSLMAVKEDQNGVYVVRTSAQAPLLIEIILTLSKACFID